MSNPLLDLSSKDELISNLLTGNKPSASEDTPVTERKTFKVKSNLLARLEDFLPKIKEANAQLDAKVKEDPKAVDIENVDDASGEQYIEMDLGLGVFDLKENVKEEDIVINPKSAKVEAQTSKPSIVMMDMDKDNTEQDSTSDSDSEALAQEQKIPVQPTDDEDIVMSS
ncbi:hypothetical protein BGZ70_010656 [Mortierella alpina]|uniref:Uncharacterized protein n=1 Tax=Mortierella alpina TaxID=64518 RepID=A0A9P6JCK3_MORAP|nr:hypothetical protein BGZ70_010656 [Mortierella alpina]